jgi:hypothetical protein
MSTQNNLIPPGLAELKTPEGTFLIQERRSVPRDPLAPWPAPHVEVVHEKTATTPALSALGGLIILGVLVGSYTAKYDLAIGHIHGSLSFPAVGFLALQLFLARAAYRLFHDVRQIASLGAYAGRCLLRYLPAVFPAVILGFVLSQFVGIPSMQAKLSSLPANLMMMADMFGVPDIDSAHWRLKIELILSISAGATWFNPIRRYTSGILLFCLAVNVFYLQGEPAWQNVLTLHGVLTADGYIPLLAFGVALHHLVLDRSSLAWQIIAAASVVLVFVSNTPVHGFCVLAALGMLTAIVTGNLQFLGKVTWLVRLGNLAFPIYVVHYVTGFALIHRMELDGFPPVVAMFAAAGVAIFVGRLFNIWFERPALDHGPALFKTACASIAPKIPLRARALGVRIAAQSARARVVSGQVRGDLRAVA